MEFVLRGAGKTRGNRQGMAVYLNLAVMITADPPSLLSLRLAFIWQSSQVKTRARTEDSRRCAGLAGSYARRAECLSVGGV